MIEGNFKDVSLPGLLQFLSSEVSKNYRIRVSTSTVPGPTSGQTGEIYLSKGFVVCAAFGLLEGEDAICEFISWSEGTFFVETLTANIEIKKNLKRAIAPSNAFVENAHYILENNVGLNTIIVASKIFGTVDWQESLRQQPLEREDFVVLGWIGEGRTMRQAVREFSFDIAQAAAILTRLIKTSSVQVLRPSATEPSGSPSPSGEDPVVQRFVTTGGQEAAAASVAQAAARAYAQEATAAVANDAFISTSFRPGSIPAESYQGKNEKSHGNPLLDPIKKIGLDLAQVRASMEARLRSRLSRTGSHPAQSPPGSHPAQSSTGSHPAQSPTGSHPAQSPPGSHSSQSQTGGHSSQSQTGSHSAQTQSGSHSGTYAKPSQTAPQSTQSQPGDLGSPLGSFGASTQGSDPAGLKSAYSNQQPSSQSGHMQASYSSSSLSNPPPVPLNNAGSFGPVSTNVYSNSPNAPGMRFTSPDYVSGQWIAPSKAESESSRNNAPNTAGADSGSAPYAIPSSNSSSATPTANQQSESVAQPPAASSSPDTPIGSELASPVNSQTAADASAPIGSSSLESQSVPASPTPAANQSPPSNSISTAHASVQLDANSDAYPAVPSTQPTVLNAWGPSTPPVSPVAAPNSPPATHASVPPIAAPATDAPVALNPAPGASPVKTSQPASDQTIPLGASTIAAAPAPNQSSSQPDRSQFLSQSSIAAPNTVVIGPGARADGAIPLGAAKAQQSRESIQDTPPQPTVPQASENPEAILLTPEMPSSDTSIPAAQPAATDLPESNALNPNEKTRERTSALPMVTIDIERLLQATFTPTQFGKLALTNPSLDPLRRQTLLDVEAGKSLISVISEGTRPAAAILNSFRYCLDRGYIEHSDPVVSMTSELLLGRMELDQYLLQRRRLTGDQLRDLIQIARNEGVKLHQILVRSGYLTVADLETLEREQKRFAFK